MPHCTDDTDDTINNSEALVVCVPTPESKSHQILPIPVSDRDEIIQTNGYGSVILLEATDILTAQQLLKPKYTHSTFDGVCVYTGAQLSVCDSKKARAYCRSVNIPFVLRPSHLSFKFGNVITPSLGIMKFRFPCPTGGSLDIDINVVDLDVPLLLELRELRQHQLLVDYLNNTMKTDVFNGPCLYATCMDTFFGNLHTANPSTQQRRLSVCINIFSTRQVKSCLIS